MKKFSSAVEKKKEELKESQIVNERNMYLEFSKKYHKKHGVSGPFDKKFNGDEKEQEKYMSGLSKAWSEYKKDKGIKPKSSGSKFDFAKKKVNESKALEMAKTMIGDGGDPNYHFVTMCDDFYFDKAGEMVRYSKDMLSSPLKVKTTPDLGAYTFGPFANLEESKMFAASIELDEINGPRMVSVEDRKTGEVYTRYLTCKMQPVWNEIEEEEDIDDEEEEFEDPSAEYTYGEEHEDDDDNDEDDEDEEDGDEYVATIPQGEDDEVEDEIEDEYDEEE
jgi:hypothetical protein